MTIFKRRNGAQKPSPESVEKLRRESAARAAEYDAAARKARKRRIIRRLIGGVIAVLILAALVIVSLRVYEYGERVRAETRSQLANTEFSHEIDWTEPLLLRVDGSIYHLSINKWGDEEYEYSTLNDDGAVVTKRVSTSAPDGRVLWRDIYRPVDIAVKIIEPTSEMLTPRIELERCIASPVDASQPSYEGEPTSLVPSGAGPEVENPQLRLCVERITLWVPDGTLQP